MCAKDLSLGLILRIWGIEFTKAYFCYSASIYSYICVSKLKMALRCYLFFGFLKLYELFLFSIFEAVCYEVHKVVTDL